MNDILKAKEILKNNPYTCVLLKDEREYHSELRGVRPLIDFLNSGEDFNSFSAADKVVGAAAAHLYVLLGVKTVFALVISERAKAVLEKNNIPVFYDEIVPNIINRNGDGFCPMESAVLKAQDSHEALTLITNKLEELGN